MEERLNKISVSIKTPEVLNEVPLALLSGSFEERLQKASSYGYDGVELIPNDPSKLSVDRIRTLLEDNGLDAAAIGTGCIAASRSLTLVSPHKEISNKAISLLKELIEFASALGTSVVTIGSFRGKASFVKSQKEARDQLDNALFLADSHAKRYKINLALEPINSYESDFLTSTKEAVDYLVSRNFSNIGLLLDTYHMNLSGEDLHKTVISHAEILRHVHIADSDRLPAGSGKIDFLNLEKSLSSIGYKYWQSAELARAEMPDKNAMETIRYLHTTIGEMHND